MTSFAILVPVKGRNVKSRLSGVLDESERRAFARHLVADLLRILKEGGLASSTYLISSDEEMHVLAAGMGARAVKEPSDRGVNQAVFAGIAAAGDAEGIVVIPSDLPLLKVGDLKEILTLRASGIDVVIAPSLGFNGTNALAFDRDSGFPLSYDSDSFWSHLAAAGRQGLSVAVCSARGLMFDVDTAEDFRALSDETLNTPSVNFARRKAK